MTVEIKYDVIIIGAGQCGTSLAYYLDKNNISYLILEKNRAFSSWYSRWENFSVNTANWMNLLPGMIESQSELDNSRYSREDIIEHFEAWFAEFKFNVKIACVTNVNYINNKWRVTTENETYFTEHLIMAVGFNQIVLPAFYTKVSKYSNQLHSSDYINSNQITTTKILIVGSGSSGVQICEDLARTQQFSIILSCSNNRYFSWTLFGISVFQYVRKFKLFDMKSQSLLGRFVKKISVNRGDPATPPKPVELYSKYYVDLQSKIVDIENNMVLFENNHSMSLDDTTIIWCTGYRVNLESIIDNSIIDKILFSNGYPKLTSLFESNIPNLYFIGLRFQRLISSHTIYGAVRDAKYLAYEIIKKITK
jgi:putative flavoprotein involved in K+ transport